MGRDVALKILPDSFAHDPERVARFKREAQVLAALNHPHIAAIYGLEEFPSTSSTSSGQASSEQAATQFLVLELVDGETLAQRLGTRGLGPGKGLPIEEALRIARQIADALEAAHEKGIVHRDLKPANIALAADDQVKVLDFGLAKHEAAAAGRAGEAGGDVTHSPTLTVHATQAGVILGTAAYMSPEQAKGRAADKRSDVWAFGCVLFEMLTGKRAFEGADVSDTLAAILRSEPDWRALPADLPAPIQKLLRRCLTKDRKDRLADLADARLEIVDALLAPSGDASLMNAGARRTLGRPALNVIAAFVVGGLAVGGAVWSIARNSRDSSTASLVRFAIHDTDRVIVSRREGDLALSPDGRTLAFVGFGDTTAKNCFTWRRTAR